MKKAVLFVWCGLVALGATACSTARDQQTGTAWCFNCHSETTALGQKILWAQAGWRTSVHAEGQVERVYTQLAAQGGCPPFVQATAATCTSNGGTHAGSAGGNICTMPATATQPQCAAAAVGSSSAFAGWVDASDPLATGGACPSFAQFKASPTAAAVPCEQVFGAAAYDIATFRCTPAAVPPATYVTQNACESASGTWVGPRYVLSGTEHAGTNAFYANSGGCQMCHTQEGFRKRVAGQYDDASAGYSIQFGPATAAWTGSPSTTPNTPLTRDVVLNPAPIGCFACHTPHSVGTPDGIHLDQAVPVGTTVTTQLGAVWGSNKARAHVCAECHQALMRGVGTVSDAIKGQVAGASGRAFIGSYFGTHHGPQADMNLGSGGAQYSGTATNGTSGFSFTFAGTYGNSPHTANPNADCVTCHMQSDYQDINVTGSFGVDAAVGGHSFTNKGFVHGAEKSLPLGCGSTGCHTVSGVSGSTGTQVAAANFTKTFGYLQAGDAYFKKSTSSTSMVDSNYQFRVNELLTKLANPSASCTGLLTAAAATTGTTLTWLTMPDGVTVDPRCLFNGTAVGPPKSAAPADDNTNASVRLLKALWNFGFVTREDKSFGVHNTTYALDLLYDACADLAILAGRDCGTTAGHCSACEGGFVTARP